MIHHKGLTKRRWSELSFFEQMANVGSEVERTIKWKNRDSEYARLAFERALELLDLTIGGAKDLPRLKELVRVRELLTDYFEFDNIYGSSDEKWQKYFYSFNFAARNNSRNWED